MAEKSLVGRHTAFDIRCRSEVYAAVERHGGQVVGPGASGGSPAPLAGDPSAFFAGDAPGLLLVTGTEFVDEASTMGFDTATLFCRDIGWGKRVFDDLDAICDAHRRAVEAKLAGVEPAPAASRSRRARRRTRRGRTPHGP